MGLRFYRRVHLFPGLTVNVSRSGPSLSVGVRGAHVTFGKRGIRRTVGLPGTGIYYTSSTGYHSGIHSAAGGGKSIDSDLEWLIVLIVIGILFALVVLTFQ